MAEPNRSPTRLPVRSTVSRSTNDDDAKRRSATLPSHKRTASTIMASAPKLAPGSGSSEMRPTLKGRGRPVSMIASSSKEPGPTSPKSSQNGSKEVGKKAMPPLFTRLTRSKSVRTTENEEPPARAATLRSHTRDHSAVITPGLSRTGGTVKKPVEPLKSPRSPNSPRVASRTETASRPISAASTLSRGSADTARTGSRPGTAASHTRQPSGTLSGLQRGGSATARLTRATSSASTAGTASKVPYPHATLPASGIGRPTFSTLQQHFSPRKTSLTKPPVPTSKSLLSDTSSLTAPALPDVVQLQTRLLQLHLLHQDSAKAQKQWERSAKRALLRKFNDAAALHRATRSKEHGLQERVNLAALQAWDTDVGLAEKLSVLATLLHELPALVEPEGRYTRLVEGFERWAGWVEDVHEARSSESQPSSASTPAARSRRSRLSSVVAAKAPRSNQVIESIGSTWKAEHAALTRKVAGLAREAHGLDMPSEGSTVAVVVKACKEMLTGMVEELRVMEKIERDVERMEKDWVDGKVLDIEEEIRRVLVAGESDKEKVAWAR